METIIHVQELTHRYGSHVICEDLNFSVSPGQVVGLLGKNGTGKTTLIKILMGFLRPFSGYCRVFGEESYQLSPETRAKIGLLFEGHLTYDQFMNIDQLERFYAPFYPNWDRSYYYQLVDLLGVPYTRKVGTMSCGQRSQIVLGLIMAQQPELLILDDYSMGLDAGYRRLFLDYMQDYLRRGKKTVLLTSHVIQDLERFVDEVIFLEHGGLLMSTSLDSFMDTFRCYRLPIAKNRGLANDVQPKASGCIKNIEVHPDFYEIFSFSTGELVAAELAKQGVEPTGLEQARLNLEDAFIGYTGRY